MGGATKPGTTAEVRASPGVPRASSGEVVKLSELALSWNPALRERLQGLRQDLSDFSSFTVALARPKEPFVADALRNPFDIARSALLDQVAHMRAHYLHAPPGNALASRLHDLGEDLKAKLLTSFQLWSLMLALLRGGCPFLVPTCYGGNLQVAASW